MSRRTYSVVLFLALLMPAAAQAAMGIPLLIYGTASPEAEITAFIQDGAVAHTHADSNGTYGHKPSIFLIPDQDNVRNGELVSFVVNGLPVPETAVFKNGGIVEVTFVGTSTVTSTNSSNPIVTTTAAPSIQALMDIVTPLKFTLRDFNTLMANWGVRGKGNAADINDDGVVNLSDFNILMMYWSI